MRRVCSLLIILCHPAVLQAYELTGNFWESGQATFHVGIDGESLTGGAWNDAFKRAMNDWTGATAFEFIAVDEHLDPCVNRGKGEFGDSLTGVDFTADVCGAEFGEQTLAITQTAGTCLNPQCAGGFSIKDADIVFKAGVPWDIYRGPRRPGSEDFERVALHELGHALGLDHENGVAAIMNPLVSDLDELQADDINGANVIYGEGATVPTVHGVDITLPASN